MKNFLRTVPQAAAQDLDAIANQTDYLGQMIERELSDYVPKQYGNRLPAPELGPREGRISGEDLQAEFEKTSKAVAAMGEALAELARANDETSHYIREAVEYVAKLAAHYQAEGVKVSEEIAARRAIAEEVRRQCDALMKQIAGTQEPQ